MVLLGVLVLHNELAFSYPFENFQIAPLNMPRAREALAALRAFDGAHVIDPQRIREPNACGAYSSSSVLRERRLGLARRARRVARRVPGREGLCGHGLGLYRGL